MEKKHGKLTMVSDPISVKSGTRKSTAKVVDVVCECGSALTVNFYHLVNGRTSSCGCISASKKEYKINRSVEIEMCTTYCQESVGKCSHCTARFRREQIKEFLEYKGDGIGGDKT